MNKLGVVIPAYREQENLIHLCQSILKTHPSTQILIVDDSPDLTSYEMVTKNNIPNVQIIHRNKKGGRGSAVLEGLKRLKDQDFNFYLEMDADFSHPPEQIPELIQHATKNQSDLVIASRYMKQSQILNWPMTRKIFSKISNLLAQFLLKVPVSDYTNGFRLYSPKATHEIVQSCGQAGSGFIALSEILVCLFYKKYKVSEVPTVFTNRIRGESSLSKNEILNAVRGLINIYQYKKRISQ